jgi:hypothetical protein
MVLSVLHDARGFRVAAVAAPGRRSLVGSLLSAAPGLRKLASRALPLVREHVTTVAAFAAVDWGCWDAGRIPGLIVTGVLVLLFDFQVRG